MLLILDFILSLHVSQSVIHASLSNHWHIQKKSGKIKQTSMFKLRNYFGFFGFLFNLK